MKRINRVTCIGILRLVVKHHSFTDPSYDYINGWGTSYSQIESCTAIISACVPAVRPLLASMMPGWFPTVERGAGSEACFATATIGGIQMSGPGHKSAGAHDEALQPKQLGQTHGGIGGYSPSGSEEEMIGHHGIMASWHHEEDLLLREMDA